MDERFERIIIRTLSFEGGYSNHKDDKGGETNYGISSKSYPNEDIKNMSLRRAKEIYYNDFWIKPKVASIKDNVIAQKVFDIGVNVGPSRSIKFLQRALNDLGAKLVVDGIIGKNTTNAIENINNTSKIIERFKYHAKTYYESLNQPVFIKGWLRRLEA